MDYYQSISTAMDFAFRTIEPEPVSRPLATVKHSAVHGWMLLQDSQVVCYGNDKEEIEDLRDFLNETEI